MTTPRHTMHGPTEREQQMINLQDAGKSVAEIAEIMNISERTISNRLQNLSVNDSGPDRAFFQMSRDGTSNLGAALQLAGGHR